MIDTKDGSPLISAGAQIYYKQGYLGVSAASIKPMPKGLRMVAGDSASSGEQGITRFSCLGATDGTDAWIHNIPHCQANTGLIIEVQFPQCWDGVNLDSPDHKSHMAYASNGCPSTHPVALPAVSVLMYYAVTDASQTARWRLSSDNYDRSLPGGYSSHADWFNGWDVSTMNTFVSNCLDKTLDCHSFLLGDGRILY